MKVYIVLSNGYGDGESVVEGVYKHADDARAHVKDLRRNTEWLYFTIQDAEVREDY